MPQRISNDDLAQFIDMEGGPEQDALEFHLCCMLDLRDARQALTIAVEALEEVYEKYASNEPVRGVMKLVIDALDRIKQYANTSLPKVS